MVSRLAELVSCLTELVCCLAELFSCLAEVANSPPYWKVVPLFFVLFLKPDLVCQKGSPLRTTGSSGTTRILFLHSDNKQYTVKVRQAIESHYISAVTTISYYCARWSVCLSLSVGHLWYIAKREQPTRCSRTRPSEEKRFSSGRGKGLHVGKQWCKADTT